MKIRLPQSFSKFIIFSITNLLLGSVSFGNTITITNDLNWSQITTGSGTGGQPSSTDDIIVRNGHTLTINVSNGICRTLTLGTTTNNDDGSINFQSNSKITLIGIFTFANCPSGNNLDMTSGGYLKCQGLVSINSNDSWTPGTGTVELTATNTLPSNTFSFSIFNNLIISSGTTTCSISFSIKSGGTLTVNSPGTLDTKTFVISGTGAFTLSAGGTLATSNTGINGISQNITVSGTKTFTDGANYTLNGASTAPFGSQFTTVKPNNLVVGANVTLDKTTYIIGALGFSGSNRTLNTSSKLTLGSKSPGTARLANITSDFFTAVVVSGNSIMGNVTVERYIPLPNSGTGRRYRLLTPTVNTAGSINANWQEGQSNTTVGVNINTNPGYGTQITGTGGNTYGFDRTQTNQSSLYYTSNGVTLGYSAVTSTLTNQLNAKTGYFLFIRGDRSIDMTLANTTGMPTSSTILRATGTILTGTQTSFTNSFTGGTGVLNMVTNPYPSPIDWSAIYSDAGTTNVATSYTLWDAEIGTRGGFVTVSNLGVSSNPSSAATVNIQPGQAFFIQATSATVPTLAIKESHKSSVNSNGIYGPQTVNPAKFSTSLFFTDGTGYRQVADGVTAVFDNSYSAAVDENDAIDINNWDENIAIIREGKHLAIESRPEIISRDTLPLFMNNMKQMVYEFQFDGSNFTNQTLQVTLIDNFTGTSTPLTVSGSTVVPFTVTADPASSTTNRFMIVFGSLNPLPVDLVSVKAFTKGKGIQVQWITRFETDMDRYEVERSADGANFMKVSAVASRGNSTQAVSYDWFDALPLAGKNFYRIKSVERTGRVKYSPIINVIFAKETPGFLVYPNPVVNSSINIQCNDLAAGAYQAKLFNNSGHLILNSSFTHSGGNVVHSISLVNAVAKGNYYLEIIGEDRLRQLLKIVIE